MRKLILLLISTYTLSSCSLFVSKDELLTHKEWSLSVKTVFPSMPGEKIKRMHYKKTEHVLSFKFNLDQSVKVTESGGKSAKTNWNWANEEKSTISLKSVNGYVEIKIEKLTNSEFFIIQEKASCSEYLDLLHTGSENWSSDQAVDVLNKMKR